MILTILFLILLLAVIKKFSNTNTAIVIGIFLILFLSNTNPIAVILKYVNILLGFLTIDHILLLVLVFNFYILSELFYLVGVDRHLNNYINRHSLKYKNIISHLLLAFSNVFEITSIDYIRKNIARFAVSAFVMPMFGVLSLFSLNIIIMTHLLIPQIDSRMYVLLFLLNLPALWWFLKRLIDYSFNYAIGYHIDLKRIFEFVPSSKLSIEHSPKTDLKLHLLIAVFYSVIAISSFFVFNLSFIALLVLFTFFVLVHLIIFAEIQVYAHDYFQEKDIYLAIWSGIQAIFPKAINVILIYALTFVYYDFLKVNVSFNNFSTATFYLFITLFILILSIAFQNYLMTLAFAMPTGLIFLNNFRAFDSFYLVSISFIISLTVLFQILSFFKNGFKDWRVFSDLSIMFIVVLICYTAYLFTLSISFIFITLLIALLIYIIYVSKAKKRGLKWKN
ncbi:MAG: hypothetical protein ACRCUP_02645 [Mycoplasmatales bacterium]